MQLIYVKDKTEQNRFLSFGRQLYRENPYFRDSMSDIVNMFLSQKTAFLHHAEVSPFFIEENGQILLRAAFIHDYKQGNMLMISFFEAVEGAQAAVDMMLQEAKSLAQKKKVKKIVIGLDAHLNYGVGLLASHYTEVPCFGFGYTPAYYLAYFSGLQEHTFVTYVIPTKNFEISREQAILTRVKRRGFTFRPASMKNLQKEIAVYTHLNNLCFQQHLWWADRTFQEDWELFHPFRWFIKGENLLIAEKDGEPIGFMLWYPDFNQIIPAGQGIGLTTLLKGKLGGLRKIDKIKIAEIGILPKYQGTGVVLGLFEMLSRYAKDKYSFCEAGWVEEYNIKSKGFGLRWHDMGSREYKKYKAFELDV
ncbi:MAG: GNAT family N-acetyltransferase [Firmicutes bacterium]|nr:GNAT family N-acetyltransferase [Bacillota bacterium]